MEVGRCEKTILITGSTKGLGRALAECFLQQGYAVGVNYHKDDFAFESLKEKYPDKNILKLKFDVACVDDVKEMFSVIDEHWGKLDVLINNAGVAVSKSLTMTEEKDFEQILDVNFFAAASITNHAIDLMKQNGQGCIMNIASILGINGGKGVSVYSMSKAALIGYTKEIAKQVGEYNIRVNAVLPGFLKTGMTEKNVSEKRMEEVVKENVLVRISSPEVVAKCVYDIVRMQDVSGQVFNLDSRQLES